MGCDPHTYHHHKPSDFAPVGDDDLKAWLVDLPPAELRELIRLHCLRSLAVVDGDMDKVARYHNLGSDLIQRNGDPVVHKN